MRSLLSSDSTSARAFSTSLRARAASATCRRWSATSLTSARVRLFPSMESVCMNPLFRWNRFNESLAICFRQLGTLEFTVDHDVRAVALSKERAIVITDNLVAEMQKRFAHVL